MEPLKPEKGPACGESLSAFLDGELMAADCERLVEAVREHPEAGRALSRYGLIREVLYSEEWQLRRWVGASAVPPTPERRRPRGRFARSWGSWSWRGALALSLVLLLAAGLRDDVSRTGLGHPPFPAFVGVRRTIPGHGPYGRVRSVSWSVPSRALRRQLATYWMLHAASLSATPTMAYPRIAAYNYAVSGRGQRWRYQHRHRHP
jgi:hypothetical protein